MEQILFVVLVDEGGKRGEGGEQVICYRESLLSGWGERSRESDSVELDGTA